VVTATGVEIGTGLRTTVIPHVVLVLDEPDDVCASAEQVGADRADPVARKQPGERETKKGAYAAAAVPAFWEIDQDRVCA
jgi:hypothetical protein